MGDLGVLLSGFNLDENDFQPFRFFDLPFELRSKILTFALVRHETQSLHPKNYRTSSGRLGIFLTSRLMCEEAYSVFYGRHTFQIFPTHGRFFGDKIVPLPARLSPRCRKTLVSLELRLGPGWNKPPISWCVDERLGLEQMTSVRILKVYVECDPSLEYFKGFRMDNPSYTDFCINLLGGILSRIPHLTKVYIDGSPSVKSGGILINSLVDEIKLRGGISLIMGDGTLGFQALQEQRVVSRIMASHCSSHLSTALPALTKETTVE